MSEEQFTKSLRELTYRKPFVPFFVELQDGRRILVENPAVAFGGGVAGFISETEGLVGFEASEVQAFARATGRKRRR
jgi:hypothetical protein